MDHPGRANTRPAAGGDRALARRVADFYERYPYPPPVDDVDAYGHSWDDARRRADSHLFWPTETYRDDRNILVAGCGAFQAAHYAVRWPRARVVGIDVSTSSLAFTEALKRKHGLNNLEIRELPIERAAALGETFDHVVCTGVLHHLPDPEAGLRALRQVLAPGGALNLMVYAPYGRVGVHMIQDYCRRLGMAAADGEIDALAATLKALPLDHPLAPLLRSSPDFADKAALADALLNPLERSYSVPELLEWLERCDLVFGRWMRQAPYLPWCGALAKSPHQARLAALPPAEQYAAIELFRGSMARHAVIAYRKHRPSMDGAPDFAGEGWLAYRPWRTPGAITLHERLPPGATAIVLNRNHTFGDLYLAIGPREEAMLAAVDGRRAIADICPRPAERERARAFFQKLWRWDQVVFDTSAPL